jgi:phosphopantetheinyl transferase (holo-ACP synthase)
MIGNDIIDLHVAAQESNWQRTGFLDKLFTSSEQALIHQAVVPSEMVWLLWSCKEAVYKIVNRRMQVCTYNPWKFNCTIAQHDGNIVTGHVLYEKAYPFVSHLSPAYIHTVAVSHRVFLDHLEVYAGERFPYHDGWVLEKNQDNIPYIWNPESCVASPVSVSHHGSYLGLVRMGDME